MKKIILGIEGMTCSACSSGLEKYLNKQEHILDASVNLVMATANITYDEEITIEDLNRYVEEAGFSSTGEFDELKEEKDNHKKLRNLIIFIILLILLMLVSMSHHFYTWDEYHLGIGLVSLILTIPFIFYGFDILKNGYKNLIHKTPNMDTLVSIGIISSFLYSLSSIIIFLYIFQNTNITPEPLNNLYFESVAGIITFLKLGRYIESKSTASTKEAIKKLVTITPDKALALINGEEKELTIDEVTKNMTLICKPGMKIAVDGVITKGETHLDETFITGESKPVKKKEGSKVIAGSINYDGYIEYKAEKIGKDSTISGIVKMVVEATNTKPKIARIADTVCGYFVPCIISIAILALIINLIFNPEIAFNTFVTVLVVACPCALGLATPLAIVVSTGVATKNGILIKSSSTIENLNNIDTIVFDKTGTLTYGKLGISEIFNYSSESNESILKKVASLEQKSTHPIKEAFSNIKNLSEVSKFANLPGVGLKGIVNKKEIYVGNNKLFNKLKIDNKYKKDEETLAKKGNSIIYVIEDNKIIALLGVSDLIRKEAKEAIENIEKRNLRVIMLTGDNEITAKYIAKKLGITEVIANVLPEEKNKHLKALKENHKVMMVGDGINDAPALSTSDIGVSIGNGTDIAIDSADIILLNNNLNRINDLFTIANKTIYNIKENLFWAFIYNLIMVLIALRVIRIIELNPMLASIAMMLSSITVVVNALRLKRIKLGGK